LSVFDTGLAEMMREAFPTIPGPEFPNLTAYDFDKIDDWYKTYEAMAQSPDDTIVMVSSSD